MKAYRWTVGVDQEVEPIEKSRPNFNQNLRFFLSMPTHRSELNDFGPKFAFFFYICTVIDENWTFFSSSLIMICLLLKARLLLLHYSFIFAHHTQLLCFISFFKGLFKLKFMWDIKLTFWHFFRGSLTPFFNTSKRQIPHCNLEIFQLILQLLIRFSK